MQKFSYCSLTHVEQSQASLATGEIFMAVIDISVPYRTRQLSNNDRFRSCGSSGNVTGSYNAIALRVC